MKKFLLFFALVAFINTSNAQLIKFIKSYGNTGYDFGRDIMEDNDSGYVATGSSSSFGSDNADAFLLKVDSLGNFMWSYNYGGTGHDWGETVLVTQDSTYAIGGYTNSMGEGGFDFYLIRTDSIGVPLWEKTYGGSDWDKAYGMVELSDGGFVMVGETYSFGNGSRDGYIVRVDDLGDTLWTKVVSGTEDDFFRDVALDGDSLVICGGSSSAGNGMLDGFIMKIHIDGTGSNTRYIGQANDDYFNSVVVAGTDYGFGGVRGYNYGTDKENMWMFKTSSDLSITYDLNYSTSAPEEDGVNDVEINPLNGDMYYIGYTTSFGYQLDGLHDIFLGKMTSTGTFVTSKNYGEKGNDIGRAVDQCRDYGAVFLADSKYFASGGSNILIIKLSYLWSYPGQIIHMEWDDITNGIEEDNKEQSELLVYPNPFTNTLNINLEENSLPYSIISLEGQILQTGIYENKQIDMSELNSGIYIIQIETENGIYQQKIIKP